MTNTRHIPINIPLISLEKIAVAPNPISPPAPWEEWIPGSLENQFSLPISYSLKGYLLVPIQLGESIHIFRIERNGVVTDGIFRSTPVVEIREDGLIETYNSIYRVSYEAKSDELAKEVR